MVTTPEKFLCFMLCLLLCGISQGWLSAVEYRYTTIADSTNPQFSIFGFNGTPALNNAGTVVFGSALTGGGQGIFAGNGRELTTVVDTSGHFTALSFEELSVNSAGTVAFRGDLDSNVGGVFKVNGNTVTTIADTTGEFVDFRGTSINDGGTVAFSARGYDSEFYRGVYVGQGGPLTTIAEAHDSDPSEVVVPSQYEPSINSHGDVAFFGYAGSTVGNAIFVGNGNDLAPIVAAEPPYRTFHPEMWCPITDTGIVAFVADGPDDDLHAYVRGVYRYANGEVERIVAAEPPRLHDLSDVMVNEAGTVAFGGRDNAVDFPRGIFTGPDPVADKVIAAGDRLDGSPVTFVRFWGQGLNDQGQVAFYAETADAVGIYLATPVPEPSVWLLSVAGTVAVSLQRRRQCRARSTR